MFSVILLAYAGLVGIGCWQGDEFGDFAAYAQEGWRSIGQRLQWSPRPLSELLFASYGTVANHTHRPLTGLFLGFLWILFLAAGLATWARLRKTSTRDSLLLVSLGLIAGFLIAGPLTEVFYWPAGAVAYLPTLAATLLIFLETASSQLDTALGRRIVSAALFVAALSSEMGAIFVLAYAGLLCAAEALRWFRREPGHTQSRQLRWFALPALCALLVLTVVATNRLQMPEGRAMHPSAQLGHPVTSAVAALSRLFELLFAPASGHGLYFLNSHFLSVMLIAVGIGLAYDAVPQHTRARLTLLAFIFLLSAWATLAVCYFHLGQAVGERHITIARCWILLALACGAIVIMAGVAPQRRAMPAGPVLMMLGVLMVWHVGPLIKAYRSYRVVQSAIASNFRSGFEGSNEVEWVCPPYGGVITPATLEPGVYPRESDNDLAPYILMYFGKERLVVRK